MPCEACCFHSVAILVPEAAGSSLWLWCGTQTEDCRQVQGCFTSDSETYWRGSQVRVRKEWISLRDSQGQQRGVCSGLAVKEGKNSGIGRAFGFYSGTDGKDSSDFVRYSFHPWLKIWKNCTFLFLEGDADTDVTSLVFECGRTRDHFLCS